MRKNIKNIFLKKLNIVISKDKETGTSKSSHIIQKHFIQNQIIKYFPMTSSILKQIYLIYLK